MLYGTENLAQSTAKSRGRTYSAAFSVIYVVMSMLVFGAVMYGLLLLHFSIVDLAIFFVFAWLLSREYWKDVH